MKNMKKTLFGLFLLMGMVAGYQSCKPKNAGNAVSGDAASKAYVAPGKYDEFYNFVSGGFSGQMSVYGLPSGRLLRVIPVFSVDPEKGYGYSEETKPMLNTSHGFVPWDDLHHAGSFPDKWGNRRTVDICQCKQYTPGGEGRPDDFSDRQKSSNCPTARAITLPLLLLKIQNMLLQVHDSAFPRIT